MSCDSEEKTSSENGQSKSPTLVVQKWIPEISSRTIHVVDENTHTLVLLDVLTESLTSKRIPGGHLIIGRIRLGDPEPPHPTPRSET